MRKSSLLEATRRAMGWPLPIIQPLIPFDLMSMATLTLLVTLILICVVCILMGCGIPTTANYLIMVTVAAPILVQRCLRSATDVLIAATSRESLRIAFITSSKLMPGVSTTQPGGPTPPGGEPPSGS